MGMGSANSKRQMPSELLAMKARYRSSLSRSARSTSSDACGLVGSSRILSGPAEEPLILAAHAAVALAGALLHPRAVEDAYLPTLILDESGRPQHARHLRDAGPAHA